MPASSENCSWIRERIEPYVDGELKGTDLEAFERHIESCETCSREFALAGTLASELRALPQRRCPDRVVEDAAARIGDAGITEEGIGVEGIGDAGITEEGIGVEGIGDAGIGAEGIGVEGIGNAGIGVEGIGDGTTAAEGISPAATWFGRLRESLGGRFAPALQPVAAVALIVIVAALFVLFQNERVPLRGVEELPTEIAALEVTEQELELAKLDVMLAFAYVNKYNRLTTEIVTQDGITDRVLKTLEGAVIDPMFPFPLDE